MRNPFSWDALHKMFPNIFAQSQRTNRQNWEQGEEAIRSTDGWQELHGKHPKHPPNRPPCIIHSFKNNLQTFFKQILNSALRWWIINNPVDKNHTATKYLKVTLIRWQTTVDNHHMTTWHILATKLEQNFIQNAYYPSVELYKKSFLQNVYIFENPTDNFHISIYHFLWPHGLRIFLADTISWQHLVLTVFHVWSIFAHIDHIDIQIQIKEMNLKFKVKGLVMPLSFHI